MQWLPRHQREVLVLISVTGASYEEAAMICDCEVGTVKSRLNRARTNLMSLLRSNNMGEPHKSARSELSETRSDLLKGTSVIGISFSEFLSLANSQHLCSQVNRKHPIAWPGS